MRNIQSAVRVSSAVRSGAIIALVVAAFGLFNSATRADDLLFDWKATNAPTPVTGYIPAPFVTNSSSPTGIGQILAPVNPGYKTIKTMEVLNPGQISNIFGNANYKINYAFYDLEGVNAGQFTNQVNLVNTAAGVNKPIIGNFDMYPVTGDTTKAPGYTAGGYAAYLASGANMANESLYPGSWSFRTKTTNPATDQAPLSPNIRSALFAMPITRMTMVEATLPLAHKHIPYVTRFNNVGNALLDSDGNTANGYQFNTTDQMLSRGDFKAMVAHYRMRGADGIHLLDGGVVNYTQTQFEQDAKDGWNQSLIKSIYDGGNAKSATLDTVVRIDAGVTKKLEEAGVVFSGVYSLTQNAGKGKLALLVSNLDSTDHTLSFPNKIGGKAILNGFLIPGGQHALLEYTGAGTQWQLVQNQLIFNGAGETDRDGVGVPEPVAMGTLALFACMMLARRGRRE